MDRRARIINFALGAWLFLSAFFWTHALGQRTNSWLVGLLIMGATLLSRAQPAARYVSAALGAWLFVSVWAIPMATRGTAWNNAIVGLAVVILSFVPARRVGAPRPGRLEERPHAP